MTGRARAERWGWTFDPQLTHAPGFTGAWVAPWQGRFLVYATGPGHPPAITPEKAARSSSRRRYTEADLAAMRGPDTGPQPVTVWHGWHRPAAA